MFSLQQNRSACSLSSTDFLVSLAKNIIKGIKNKTREIKFFRMLTAIFETSIIYCTAMQLC